MEDPVKLTHYQKYKDMIKEYHQKYPEKVKAAKQKYTKKIREAKEKELALKYLDKHFGIKIENKK